MQKLKPMPFSEFVDLTLVLLYMLEQQDLERRASGRFYDVNAIAKDISRSASTFVPIEWVFDVGKVIEAQRFAQCVFELGGTCRARLTGEGRLHIEQTGLLKKYRRKLGPSLGKIAKSERVHEEKGPETIDEQRAPAFDLVKKMESKIKRDETLDDLKRGDLHADLESVMEQLKKREPNRAVLAALLEPFSQVRSVGQELVTLVSLLNP